MDAGSKTREQERLEILAKYRILDSSREQSYDDLTVLAARLCRAPIALISIVDKDRQWFKSQVGLTASETPRDQSFCVHAFEADAMMVVEDARRDPRFMDNPLVVDEPGVVFYAGAVLRSREGIGLGTLCVIDDHPRTLSEQARDDLLALGRQATTMLELRRTSAELADALTRVRTLEGFLAICSFCSAIRDDAGAWHPFEQFVESRTDATFTHGLCQSCYDKRRWED